MTSHNDTIKELCNEIEILYNYLKKLRILTKINNSYILKRLDGNYELMNKL
jgi:hypothetical protein